MSVPRSRPHRRIHVAARPLAFAVAFAAAVGCTRETSAPPLDAATYVEVMVALRMADNETSSEAEFVQRREQILQEAGVTDSMLVQWARARGEDIRFMAELWDTINARLNATDEDATAR